MGCHEEGAQISAADVCGARSQSPPHQTTSILAETEGWSQLHAEESKIQLSGELSSCLCRTILGIL